MEHIRPIADVRDELLPTRQSLLSRLKDWEDQDSWKTFFDTYWRLIYQTATRAGLTDPEAQDVVQETVISVSKSMKSFEYRRENGSFKAWLLRLTQWRIHDQFRRRQKGIVSSGPAGSKPRNKGLATGTGTELDDSPIETISEASWDEDWESNLLEAALGRIKHKVEPFQYQIFHLLVFKEWSAAKVAQTLKVSRPRIYLVKHRINNLLKKEITHLRSKPI